MSEIRKLLFMVKIKINKESYRVGFQKWKLTTVTWLFIETYHMNSNFSISLITFAYELRFLRTTYARARFNVPYNFHEEHFLKF